MGLLLYSGIQPGYPWNDQRIELKNDCLRRAGLAAHYDTIAKDSGREPEDSIFDFLPYPARDAGVRARQEEWAAPHLRALTQSEYEMIVPVEFEMPIPMFGERSPADFGISYMAERAWPSNSGMDLSTSWHEYYTGTPIDEIFLLSAPALLKECRAALNSALAESRRLPKRELTIEDGDFLDRFHQTDLFGVFLIICWCQHSIKYNETLYLG